MVDVTGQLGGHRHQQVDLFRGRERLVGRLEDRCRADRDVGAGRERCRGEVVHDAAERCPDGACDAAQPTRPNVQDADAKGDDPDGEHEPEQEGHAPAAVDGVMASQPAGSGRPGPDGDLRRPSRGRRAGPNVGRAAAAA
jgi:hypothetical protein